MIVIHSIQIGLPKTYKEEDDAGVLKPWRTAIFKEPVNGPVRATTLGFEGDGSANLQVHGGPNMALNVYCLAHYPYWKTELKFDHFPTGAFGENLTLDGVREEDVCIGDVFEAGGVRLEISQPRQPCNTLQRRWKTPDLAKRVETNGFTGWYFRVIKEGELSAGLELKLIERPNPKWTVRAANDVMHHQVSGAAAAQELAALEVLSGPWRDVLKKRK